MSHPVKFCLPMLHGPKYLFILSFMCWFSPIMVQESNQDPSKWEHLCRQVMGSVIKIKTLNMQNFIHLCNNIIAYYKRGGKVELIRKPMWDHKCINWMGTLFLFFSHTGPGVFNKIVMHWDPPAPEYWELYNEHRLIGKLTIYWKRIGIGLRDSKEN